MADTLNSRIQEFTATGQFVQHWATDGLFSGQFKQPEGIAIGEDDRLYVAHPANDRIVKYNADGNFLREWNWDLHGSVDVAVAGDGRVYVADTGRDRVVKFTANGGFLGTWGISGGGEGQFRYPRGVAVGADGRVYVADTERPDPEIRGPLIPRATARHRKGPEAQDAQFGR